MDKFPMSQLSVMAQMQAKQQAHYERAMSEQKHDETMCQAACSDTALPLMTQEQDRVYSAIADLERQLDWLIEKIQPICQPPQSVPTGAGSTGQQIEATPSVTRQALIEFRKRIDEMTRRISEIKYTIEV